MSLDYGVDCENTQQVIKRRWRYSITDHETNKTTKLSPAR